MGVVDDYAELLIDKVLDLLGHPLEILDTRVYGFRVQPRQRDAPIAAMTL